MKYCTTLTLFWWLTTTLAIATIFHQKYINATAIVQKLNIWQPVSDIACITMKEDEGRHGGCKMWWLANKLKMQLCAIVRTNEDVFMSEAVGRRGIYIESWCWRLFGIIEQHVLDIVQQTWSHMIHIIHSFINPHLKYRTARLQLTIMHISCNKSLQSWHSVVYIFLSSFLRGILMHRTWVQYTNTQTSID